MGNNPRWFRWLTLFGICLGIAAIVIGFLKATLP